MVAEQIGLRSLHQLPQPPSDFTGREELIDQLLNDFNFHKGATISGLTGMGGIGKTALGDRRDEGLSLGNLGNAYVALGEAHKAVEFYQQALIIAREIGDRRGEGNALFNMGLVKYDLDERRKAIDLVRQAMKILETIESPNAERARDNLKIWGALE